MWTKGKKVILFCFYLNNTDARFSEHTVVPSQIFLQTWTNDICWPDVLVLQVHAQDAAIEQVRGFWHHVIPRAPPLFAFFIWAGNKVILVQHINQRSVGVNQESLHNKDVRILLFFPVFGLRNNLCVQGVNVIRLLVLVIALSIFDILSWLIKLLRSY